MFTLAIVVIFFTILQFTVSAINLFFKQKIAGGKPEHNYLVSVLIPARNEENNIRNLLSDLIKQPYQNIEIIVFDDQSEDQTPQTVEQMAETDPRIRLICSDGLPTGWLGKNHACHSLSIHAKGDYLLFLDADVRVAGDIIGSGVAFADKHKLGLLSIFPRQLLFTIGERSTVPIMNYILLTLLPLPMVLWSHFSSLAAANGQFMLFNASAYQSLWPHQQMKDNKVEDIAIARHLKVKGFPVACLTGDDSIQCRMYTGFKILLMDFQRI
jgi:glycosyltransferase involved in cell wall biosynthesis